MKHAFFKLTMFVVIGSLFGSCIKDSCNSTKLYRTYTPIYKQMSEVREMVKAQAPKEIANPGKIYTYGEYLFMNDRGAGIHIINIKDQANPTNIAFLNIPGNIDMAVRGSYLYADNFIDLVVFDLSDLNNIIEVGREENVFPNNVSVHERASYWLVDKAQGVAIDWLVEEVEVECDFDGNWGGGVLFSEDMAVTPRNGGTNEQGGGTSSGTAGSMARFALMSDYLYVIDQNGSMNLFDLTDPTNPDKANDVEVGWNIETIFPYYRDNDQYLFIGAQDGMYIFNNNNPASPFQESKFIHVNSCDPVVAEDTMAFVTLRNGTECEGFSNELQLIDIKDLNNPKLVSKFDLHNPHGLGFDNGLLFICDAAEGLKVYDLRETTDNVLDHEIAHIIGGGFFAYDVIPYKGTLILSTDVGFHLIDYTNPNDIKIVGEILNPVSE